MAKKLLTRQRISPTPAAAPAPRAPGEAAQVELSRFGEKVRAASVAGRLQLLPWLDNITEETELIRRAYRPMLKSSIVKAALLGKAFAVAALDLQVTPASDSEQDRQAAEFCRFSVTGGLVAGGVKGGLRKTAETVLLPMLLDGCSISEKVWRDDVIERGKWAGKRTFRDLKAKDGVRAIVDEFKNVVGVRSTKHGQNDTFDPRDFVISPYLPLFENPAGMSDLRSVYSDYWMLDTVKKLRVIHLEKFTSPMLKGTYQDEGDRADLESNLEAAKSRTWMTTPEGVKVEALQIATRGEAEFQQAEQDYMQRIALGISGAFLQMMTSNSGGDVRGDSSVQQDTASLFVWHLAALLAEVLADQYFPDLVDHNFAGAGYPTASLASVNDADLKPSAELDALLVGMGLPMSKASAYKRYQREPPAGPDDVLTPPPPPGPFGGPPDVQTPALPAPPAGGQAAEPFRAAEPVRTAWGYALGQGD